MNRIMHLVIGSDVDYLDFLIGHQLADMRVRTAIAALGTCNAKPQCEVAYAEAVIMLTKWVRLLKAEPALVGKPKYPYKLSEMNQMLWDAWNFLFQVADNIKDEARRAARMNTIAEDCACCMKIHNWNDGKKRRFKFWRW